eukprot:7382167-Prymnesium_polylepis.6
MLTVDRLGKRLHASWTSRHAASCSLQDWRYTLHSTAVSQCPGGAGSTSSVRFRSVSAPLFTAKPPPLCVATQLEMLLPITRSWSCASPSDRIMPPPSTAWHLTIVQSTTAAVANDTAMPPPSL